VRVIIGYLAPKPNDLRAYERRTVPATTERLNEQANVAVASDAATTLVGLAGGAVETHPLVGMSPLPAATLGFSALKIACVNSMAHAPDRTDLQKITDLCNAYAVVGAAFYNNLAVVAGGCCCWWQWCADGADRGCCRPLSVRQLRHQRSSTTNTCRVGRTQCHAKLDQSHGHAQRFSLSAAPLKNRRLPTPLLFLSSHT
jgi:hypothetical protein